MRELIEGSTSRMTQERVRLLVLLVRLEAIADDFDFFMWITCKVAAPVVGLAIIPLLVDLAGHGLHGEVFQGGVIIYAILLAVDLLWDYDKARNLVLRGRTDDSERESDLQRNHILTALLLVPLAVLLAVMSARLPVGNTRTYVELGMWIGWATILGLIACWQRLRLHKVLLDELADRLGKLGSVGASSHGR